MSVEGGAREPADLPLTSETVTGPAVAELRAVFVDYSMVGIATEFPLDPSGPTKPTLSVGSRFLAVGDSVPTYVSTATESLGDGWVMVRLDQQLPSEAEC